MLTRIRKPLFIHSICFLSLCLFLQAVLANAEDTFPPMPSESTFLDQLDFGCYPTVSSPDKPPLIQWDFSDGKVYSYNYTQKVLSNFVANGIFSRTTDKPKKDTTEFKGKLSLKSEKNKLARLVLEDIVINSNIGNQDKNQPRVISLKLSPLVIQGLTEDGKMENNNNSQESLIKTLFSMPPKPLRVGESITIPDVIFFNAMGNVLPVKGNTIITLVDYVQINGKACAKLETKIDLSNLTVPEEVPGRFMCQTIGKSIMYFNIQDRHFMSGKIAMVMSIRLETPMPKHDIPKEMIQGDLPEKIIMIMDSDNFISIEYIEN